MNIWQLIVLHKKRYKHNLHPMQIDLNWCANCEQHWVVLVKLDKEMQNFFLDYSFPMQKKKNKMDLMLMEKQIQKMEKLII